MDKLRTKVQNADWWEITYLIIYGAIFTYEFLGTTMFEITWPPKFGYIFLAASALYTIAKFIWHNTYTKKEMILSAVILFAFLMPALLTEYRFLWWVGFLIVGAKDVDFDKILKVYLTIGVTIMVAAFAASQMGWIENLVYVVNRDDQWIYRNSFGSIYPTDFAAHIFYLAIAGLCFTNVDITLGKIINLVILAFFVYDKCGARTSTLCLLALACLTLYWCLLGKKIRCNWLYYLMNALPIGFAGLFISLVHMYSTIENNMTKLDRFLSFRLSISKRAIEQYDYTLFGQTIEEVGLGKSTGHLGNYFFIDDSYIRIALLYGIVLFIVVLILFWCDGCKAIKNGNVIIVFAIAVIGIHSFMEHHMIELAYNPILCYAFAKYSQVCEKVKLEDTNVS